MRNIERSNQRALAGVGPAIETPRNIRDHGVRGSAEIARTPIESYLRTNDGQWQLNTNSSREYSRPRTRAQNHSSSLDSSEVGHRKPEPAIYELTTSMLAVPPSAILYLDDFAADIEGAKAAGWRPIHVVDIESALAELDHVLSH